MGKVVVAQFISLDGVIETPEKWHFPYLTEDMQADTTAQIMTSDAMLMGRETFVGFAAFWPTQVNNEFGIADKLNSVPKYVVSNTLKSADWNNSQIISGNIEQEIPKLKQQVAGRIGITGSAKLVHSLMQADLIDEYELMIHPIVVGSGLRLFQDGMQPLKLKVIESKTYASGVVLLRLQPERQ